jgi:hypothetical protein
VALVDGGALVAQAPVQEGTAGVARWLQELIYGDLLSDAQLAGAAAAAEQAEGFVVEDSELAGYAEQVWAACLQETAKSDDEATGKQHRRCNPSCLRQRMTKQLPQARKLLASEGYTHLTRRLLEQGVVTYTVKHMRGCLSPIKSAEWGRDTRGVEVPSNRLPDDVVL